MKNKFDIKKIKGIKIFGFPSKSDLLQHLDSYSGILIAINAEKILNSSESLKKIINDNLGYSDGIGAVWAMKKNGVIVQKIPGTELWIDIINKFYQTRTFYLIGSRQKIITSVVQKLKKNYDGINILGHRNGFFESQEDYDDLIIDIQIKKPDIVFVAMGSPKQEELMYRLEQINSNCIYMGLGGSFDIYSGLVSRAPNFLIDSNMEWAYRWFRNPFQRTRRMFTLLKFFVSIN